MEQITAYFKNHTKDLKSCEQNAETFNVSYATLIVTSWL